MTLEHSMPAWNPVTGQIAFVAGFDNNVLAVQCPGDDMGQFLLNIGARDTPTLTSSPYTHVYYRANGELLLLRNQRLHVISPVGEVLRSIDTDEGARAHAYDERCGLLSRVGVDEFSWRNVDTMERGDVLNPRTNAFRVGGTPDCGLLESSSQGTTLISPSGQRTPLNGPNEGVWPLREGYLVGTAVERHWRVVSASGTFIRDIFLDQPGIASVVTPDGYLLSGNTRWYLGVEPGPQLYLHSGMNWAHTNSPL